MKLKLVHEWYKLPHSFGVGFRFIFTHIDTVHYKSIVLYITIGYWNFQGVIGWYTS